MKRIPAGEIRSQSLVQVFFAFPPKAQNLKNQAGLLARLTSVGLLILYFPQVRKRTMACLTKAVPIQIFTWTGQTYSCGDSSGITPDSLLIPGG